VPSAGTARSRRCSDPSGASCELCMELRLKGGVVAPGSGHRADADGALVIGAPAFGRETIGDTIAHIGLAQLTVLVQRHQGVRGLVGVSGPEVERAVGALGHEDTGMVDRSTVAVAGDERRIGLVVAL